MVRVAVTGASGFVGGAVCRAFVAYGWEVLAHGRRPAVEPAHVGGAAYRSWDIGAGPLLDPPAVDVVVHAAALVTDHGPAAVARRVNVDGTRHVLATFRGARFVHISSASVYDQRHAQDDAIEDEADGVRHDNPYSATKAAAERLITAVRPDAIVLRPHAVHGPGDTTLVPRVLAAIRRGTLRLPGDGHRRHSLTHVDNLVAAIRLGCAPDAPAGTYNIADADPVDLAATLRAELAARGLPVTVRPVPARVALLAAHLVVAAHRLRRREGPPPLTPYAVRHLARDRTFSLARARERLGYAPTPVPIIGDAPDRPGPLR